MTEIHNAKYNFKEHILNLSNNDDFDDALKEWIKLPELYKKLQCGSCQCICQRQIKNFYYLYNKITHKYINVGTECYKKFNFTITKKKINKLLQDILNKYAKGEYANIDDLDEYSINIQLIIVQDLTDMYRKCNSNVTMLYMLKDNVEELINDYNFTCLEELKNLIIETINVLEKEKFEAELLQQKIEEDIKLKEKIKKEENQRIIDEDIKLKEEKFIKLQKEKIKKHKEKIINKTKFIELDKKNLLYFKNNNEDLEFYISYKLGHMVFNFTSQSKDNDIIIEKFNKFFKNQELIYNINKTEFIGLFVDITDTNNYSRKDLLNHKDVIKIDSQKGTIGIIMDILNNIS